MTRWQKPKKKEKDKIKKEILKSFCWSRLISIFGSQKLGPYGPKLTDSGTDIGPGRVYRLPFSASTVWVMLFFLSATPYVDSRLEHWFLSNSSTINMVSLLILLLATSTLRLGWNCIPTLFFECNRRPCVVLFYMNGHMSSYVQLTVYSYRCLTVYTWNSTTWVKCLRGIGEDKMCWTPAKSRGFEVSSYSQALLGVCTQSFS